jgi:hypothetical protein
VFLSEHIENHDSVRGFTSKNAIEEVVNEKTLPNALAASDLVIRRNIPRVLVGDSLRINIIWNTLVESCISTTTPCTIETGDAVIDGSIDRANKYPATIVFKTK